MAESSMTDTSNKVVSETDELRIIRAARQDPRAFGELYILYVERVFRYLYSRVGSVHDAEDLTSQTFLVALESLSRLREDRHFAPWLFTIARSKAMDSFRQKKNTSSIEEVADIPVENDPMSGVIQSDQTAILTKLIRALSEDERELLRLRFLAEMSFPVIAHLLHRNESAVKKSTYRVLARLHSQLEFPNE
jgi:RNA polymerase sigma-70 factor (ECF subfamily)